MKTVLFAVTALVLFASSASAQSVNLWDWKGCKGNGCSYIDYKAYDKFVEAKRDAARHRPVKD